MNGTGLVCKLYMVGIIAHFAFGTAASVASASAVGPVAPPQPVVRRPVLADDPRLVTGLRAGVRPPRSMEAVADEMLTVYDELRGARFACVEPAVV